MKHLKLYDNYNKEKDTITLYHGTCEPNAQSLSQNGWKPNKVSSGSNQGQSKYLYLTSMEDDALWFAEEKGCDTILKIKNIPIDYLIFDPEDGDDDLYDYKIENAISKIQNGYSIPIKLALTKSLDREHFEIL